MIDKENPCPVGDPSEPFPAGVTESCIAGPVGVLDRLNMLEQTLFPDSYQLKSKQRNTEYRDGVLRYRVTS
jgi:hypothetical protein